ncbi:S1 family peptidase [Pseudonocardia phyllosphaerae]|uniref:S1 family peptidase n=1 Tax=Pseudonocardia phyllosphaerae TaxID=3390502 RepID=UPI00397CD383
MPLRHPHRLLAGLAAAVVTLGIASAAPAVAGPALPDELPALTEDAAAARVPAVTEAAGPALAGVWFDPSGGGRLMAGTWDPALAPVLSALGATPVVRDEPRRDPAAAARALTDRLGARMPAGLAAYGTDPRSEQLVLDVVEGPGSAGLARALTTGLDPAAVRVEQVPAAAHRQATVGGGDGITDGSRRCTAGFATTDGSARWLLTAGHCTRGSGTWYTGADEDTIGSGARTAQGADAGAIPVQEGDVSATAGGTRVTGTRSAPVGTTVCLYGSTSGRSCGPVQRTGVTVNFDGQSQPGLTQVGACAREGDSGAPYVTADGQAQGLHTGAGGANQCTAYFTPVATATRDLGLTVLTG